MHADHRFLNGRSLGHASTAAILVALPIALLIVNDSWAFTPVTSGVDPWFYTGLFVHFPEHLERFAGTYYVTRLPHILPGALAYALFEPPFGSYALRLFYWYLSVFSLYGIVRATGGTPLAALLASVILGTSVYFLWAIGWDYVDGAGVSFMLAAAFCLLVPARRGPHAWVILGGVFQLFAVTTYVLIVLLIPLQLGYVLAARLRERRALYPLLWVPAGWLLGYALLSAINWSVAGPFDFLNQFRVAFAISGTRATREVWELAFDEWVPKATWLFTPAVALLCSAALLGRAARNAGGAWRNVWREPGVAESVTMLLASSLFLSMEVAGLPVLQISFYAIYLLPFSMLVISATLSQSLGPAWDRSALIAAVSVIAAAIVPFAAPVAARYPYCSPFCELSSLAWFLVPAAAIVVTAALVPVRGVALAAALALAAVNVTFADIRIYQFPSDSIRRDQQALVLRATTVVGDRHGDDRIRFWYDYGEELGPVYRSIAATYIWTYTLISEEFPSRIRPVNREEAPLAAGDSVVVLTSRSPDEASSAIEAQGFNPRLTTEDHFAINGKSFRMLSYEIVPKGRLIEIPLTSLLAHDGTIQREPSGATTVTTPAVPYGYAATADLRRYLDPAMKRPSLVLTIADVTGRLGVCVLNADETDCLARQMIDGQRKDERIVLLIEEAAFASRLVIQSWDDAQPGRVSLTKIAIAVD
jgi:hypothetical protein